MNQSPNTFRALLRLIIAHDWGNVVTFQRLQGEGGDGNLQALILLSYVRRGVINPLNLELNPICYLLALLAHHFLHVSRIRVKSLTLRLLMSYIYIYICVCVCVCVCVWSAYS